VSRRADPTHEILEEIHASAHLSQRSLASKLGIALGLTNSLMRGLVQRGWVRATRVQRHRVKYLLTPAGIAEKARLSQAAFQNAVDRYRVARLRVQGTFAAVSAEWDVETGGRTPGRRKPIVFYGTGEVAEIGFICLQETDLDLVAVIDDQGRDRFFGVPVLALGEAQRACASVSPDARLLVMSLERTGKIDDRLAALEWPADQIVWI
jgi:DNA-binding MarR family transcriptional regulator